MDDHIRPARVRIESTPACQLRCPSCPTTSGATKPLLGRGYLKLADFERFLDTSPTVRHVEMSNYGEMFLNPELLGIMEAAQRRRVTLSANNGVNLNTVRPDVLEGLVKYGFQWIAVSLDGATPETYRQYRVGGDLEVVLENIRTINRFKEQYQSKLPVLLWQFIIFGFNEHELDQAREMARSLRMNFRAKLAWGDFSPVRDLVRIRNLVGSATRAEYEEQNGVEYLADYICSQLWDDPQINSDGKVLGCCRNFWMEFGGNAFDDGIEAVVNSEKMRYSRAMLEGKAAEREDNPCTTCSVYISRKAHGKWMTRPQTSSG